MGDRSDTVGHEYDRVLSRTLLAFHAGASGVVMLFRYGVVVMIGLTPREQEKFLESVRPRVQGEFTIPDEETAAIELSRETEDHIAPGGPICIKAMSPEYLLVISDALAKSVVLAMTNVKSPRSLMSSSRLPASSHSMGAPPAGDVLCAAI